MIRIASTIRIISSSSQARSFWKKRGWRLAGNTLKRFLWLPHDATVHGEVRREVSFRNIKSWNSFPKQRMQLLLLPMTTSPWIFPSRLDPKEPACKMQARTVRWKAGQNPDCTSQIREKFKAKLPRHDPTTARTTGRSTASPQARPGWEIPLQHITFALMTRKTPLHSHDCSSQRLQHREKSPRG